MEISNHNHSAAPARKSALSWLNIAFCAMVLLIHCASQAVTTLRVDSWQFACVYLAQKLSFVSVYGFFFLSGVKLMLPRKRRMGVWEYYRGRLKSIFLPYILSALVYYWWFGFHLGWLTPSLRGFLLGLLRGNLISPFYFITALAQFVLLMPLLRYITEHVSPVFSLPLALCVSWMSEMYCAQFLQLFFPDLSFPYGDRVFTTYLFYYLAGCYVGQQYDAFVAALRKNGRFVCAAFALTAAFNLFLTYRSKVLSLWSPLTQMAHLTYLLAAIAFYFYLAVRIDRPLPRLLARVDRASYLIYLYHALVLSALDLLLAAAGVSSIGTQFALHLAVVYSVVPALCILWQSGFSAAKSKLKTDRKGTKS